MSRTNPRKNMTNTETFTVLQRSFLDNFYDKKVEKDDVQGKIKLLQRQLSVTSFHAYGGHETPDEELTVLEFTYLSDVGQI